MKRKRIIGVCLIAVFTVTAVISGGMFWKQYRDAQTSRESFSKLAEIAGGRSFVSENTETLTETSDSEDLPEKDSEKNIIGGVVAEVLSAREKYGSLHEQNSDFIGWICIDGTEINYPVMQSPENPGFYLKHGFDKSRSEYGVPYLDEACVIGESNNLIIYGHHMKNGTMFCDLDGYADPAFCELHPVIHFDTLSSFGDYEVIAVFRYDTNHDDFRYNRYADMDETTFGHFMKEVHLRELYSTGKSASYRDQLLTLSTCEYSYKNGRLVVVAGKVMP